VFIKIRTSRLTITKSIYLRKTTLISSRSTLSMEIYYLAILSDRDFLFESKEIFYLTIYAYLIDADTKAIILKNNFDYSIYISCNYRLDRVLKLDFANVF